MNIDILRESLSTLSADAEEQIQHLKELGLSQKDGDQSNIDELGLEFGDVEWMIPTLLETGQIDGHTGMRLIELGGRLRYLSGERNADFWTISALRNDPRWAEVRAIASSCLEKLVS